jgi:hypothetical protein
MDDMHAQSRYDSGYDSSYSTASGADNPPPPIYNYPDVSDQADHMIYNAFVNTIVTTSTNNHPPAQPTTQRYEDPSAFDPANTSNPAHLTLIHSINAQRHIR